MSHIPKIEAVRPWPPPPPPPGSQTPLSTQLLEAHRCAIEIEDKLQRIAIARDAADERFTNLKASAIDVDEARELEEENLMNASRIEQFKEDMTKLQLTIEQLKSRVVLANSRAYAMTAVAAAAWVYVLGVFR